MQWHRTRILWSTGHGHSLAPTGGGFWGLATTTTTKLFSHAHASGARALEWQSLLCRKDYIRYRFLVGKVKTMACAAQWFSQASNKSQLQRCCFFCGFMQRTCREAASGTHALQVSGQKPKGRWKSNLYSYHGVHGRKKSGCGILINFPGNVKS